jgi:hypothetical protein
MGAENSLNKQSSSVEPFSDSSSLSSGEDIGCKVIEDPLKSEPQPGPVVRTSELQSRRRPRVCIQNPLAGRLGVIFRTAASLQ